MTVLSLMKEATQLIVRLNRGGRYLHIQSTFDLKNSFMKYQQNNYWYELCNIVTTIIEIAQPSFDMLDCLVVLHDLGKNCLQSFRYNS